MPTDIRLLLRKWDFDLDSATLGPIRCASLDVVTTFAEFEERIKANSIDSIEFARRVFQSVAHRLTGDETVDAECAGPTLTDDEVSGVPVDELDAFCNHLILRLRGTKAPDTADKQTPSGCEGLASAMSIAIVAKRAARKKMTDSIKKSLTEASNIEAILKRDYQGLIGGEAATQRALNDFLRTEEMMKAARHDATAGFGLQIVEDIKRAEEQRRLAIGAFVGPGNGIFGADALAADALSLRAMMVNAMGGSFAVRDMQASQGYDFGTSAIKNLDFYSKSFGGGLASEASMAAAMGSLPTLASNQALPTESHMERFTPPAFHIATNPIHKTNELVRNLLAHQKEEAAKAEVDKVEAKIDSGESKQLAASGLFYTRASFWTTVIAFTVPFTWGVWLYVDSKADAANAKAEAIENAKRAEAKMDQQRAEYLNLIAVGNERQAALEKAAQRNGQAFSGGQRTSNRKKESPSSAKPD
ncbi:hypothetical protein ACXZ1M_16990 [Duganella sp. PWIR1]